MCNNYMLLTRCSGLYYDINLWKRRPCLHVLLYKASQRLTDEGVVGRKSGCYLMKYNMPEIDRLKYGTLMEACGCWGHGVIELLLSSNGGLKGTVISRLYWNRRADDDDAAATYETKLSHAVFLHFLHLGVNLHAWPHPLTSSDSQRGNKSTKCPPSVSA